MLHTDAKAPSRIHKYQSYVYTVQLTSKLLAEHRHSPTNTSYSKPYHNVLALNIYTRWHKDRKTLHQRYSRTVKKTNITTTLFHFPPTLRYTDLPYCHITILLHCYTAILPYCHTAIPPYRNIAILHTSTLPYHHTAISSNRHTTAMLHCSAPTFLNR